MSVFSWSVKDSRGDVGKCGGQKKEDEGLFQP